MNEVTVAHLPSYVYLIIIKSLNKYLIFNKIKIKLTWGKMSVFLQDVSTTSTILSITVLVWSYIFCGYWLLKISLELQRIWMYITRVHVYYDNYFHNSNNFYSTIKFYRNRVSLVGGFFFKCIKCLFYLWFLLSHKQYIIYCARLYFFKFQKK